MRVLLARAAGTADGVAPALREQGLDVDTDDYIRTESSRDAGATARARELLDALAEPGACLILTSAAAMRALDDILGAETVTTLLQRAQSAGSRFAAAGPASAAALADHGIAGLLAPSAQTISGLLHALEDTAPGTAVLPSGAATEPEVGRILESRGWHLVTAELYATVTVSARPSTAEGLAAGDFAAVVLRSPSAVRAVAQFADIPVWTAIVAGGPATARAAELLGLRVAEVSVDSRPESIATAVLAALRPRAAAR